MYKTWFFDESISKFDEVETIIISYSFPEWLICHEKFNSNGEPKPHYHILVKLGNDGDIKPWNAMMSRIKKHYKLIEKNKLLRAGKTKGGTTCFGILKKQLTDIETFKRYLCKDGNVRSNMSEETLKHITQQGQAVARQKEFKVKCLNYVEAWYHKIYKSKFTYEPYHDELQIKTLILEFYIQERAPWCKSSILSLYNYCIAFSTIPPVKLSPKNIILRLELLTKLGNNF